MWSITTRLKEFQNEIIDPILYYILPFTYISFLYICIKIQHMLVCSIMYNVSILFNGVIYI